VALDALVGPDLARSLRRARQLDSILRSEGIVAALPYHLEIR